MVVAVAAADVAVVVDVVADKVSRHTPAPASAAAEERVQVQDRHQDAPSARTAAWKVVGLVPPRMDAGSALAVAVGVGRTVQGGRWVLLVAQEGWVGCAIGEKRLDRRNKLRWKANMTYGEDGRINDVHEEHGLE